MPTRNVVITEHQAAMIERLVKSGRYQNASEVLRDGLRLVEARNTAFEEQLAALRAAAKIGWDDIEAGRYTEFASRDELRDYLDALVDRVIAEQRK